MAAMRVILMLMAAFACRIASCIQQAPSNATTLQTSNSALASAEAQFARIATLPPPISVRTSQELRNALLQPGNLDIVLLDDINLDDKLWDNATEIVVQPGRIIQLRADLNYYPNIATSVDAITKAGGKTFNFSHRSDIFNVQDGGLLAFNGLHVTGIPNPDAFIQQQIESGNINPFIPFGSSVYPSALCYNGCQLLHNYTIVDFVAATCNISDLSASVLRIGLALPNPDNIALIQGGQTPAIYINGMAQLTFAVTDFKSKQPVGTLYVNVNNTVRSCVLNSNGTTFLSTATTGSIVSSTSGVDSNSSTSVPTWAWIVLALGLTFLLIAGVAYWRYGRMKRRKARGFIPVYGSSSSTNGLSSITIVPKDGLQSSSGGGGDKGGGDGSGELTIITTITQKSDDGSADIAVVMQLKDAWRTRIGQVHDIDFLSTIGRGSFGTVYLARWQGINVAVKLVEHTLSSSISRSIQREAALATSVSHPNVIATFKVATVGIEDVQGALHSNSEKTYTSYSDGMNDYDTTTAADSGQVPARISNGSSSALEALDKTLEAIESASPHDGGWENGTCVTVDSNNIVEELMDEEEVHGEEERSANHRMVATMIIMELCDYGSVQQLIDERRLFWRQDGTPDRLTAVKVLIDAALGLDYLHAVAGVIHGDIKPANILIQSAGGTKRGWCAKIADFGVARTLTAVGTGAITASLGLGTQAFTAPESIASGKLSQKADVYSFGVTMWCLWTLKKPFENIPPAQLYHQIIIQGARPSITSDEADADTTMPSGYKELMERCWACDPAVRPSMDVVLGELRGIVAGMVNGGNN